MFFLKHDHHGVNGLARGYDETKSNTVLRANGMSGC